MDFVNINCDELWIYFNVIFSSILFYCFQDPFLRISRIAESGGSIPICKTEVINNNLNPVWKPLCLTMQQYMSKVVSCLLFAESRVRLFAYRMFSPRKYDCWNHFLDNIWFFQYFIMCGWLLIIISWQLVICQYYYHHFLTTTSQKTIEIIFVCIHNHRRPRNDSKKYWIRYVPNKMPPIDPSKFNALLEFPPSNPCHGFLCLHLYVRRERKRNK